MSESYDGVKPKYNASVIVTSDSCAKNPDKDESGPYVVKKLEASGLFVEVNKLVVPDDKGEIIKHINRLIDSHYDPALIITVGGTGLCPRDVTPEATSSLYEKHCTGITAALQIACQRYSPFAALSCLSSGIVGGTLIVNFPGKLAACNDCFTVLNLLLEHALEQVRFDHDAYIATHRRQQKKTEQQQKQKQQQPQKQKQRPQQQHQHQDNIGPTEQLLPTVSSSLNVCVGPTRKPSRASSVASSVHRRSFKKATSASTDPTTSGSGKPLTIEEIEASRNEISSIGQSLSDADESSQEVASQTTSQRGTRVSRIKPRKTNIPSVKRHHPTQHKTPLKDANQALQLNFHHEQTKCKFLPNVKIPRNESQFPLIDYDQCLDILSTFAKSLMLKLNEPQEITLKNEHSAYASLGEVLAQDITPKRLVPPYATSTMDGYVLHIPKAIKDAIHQTKTFPPAKLMANLEEFELKQKDAHWQNKFFCYQVNTGGRLPKYGYNVVPFEKTSLHSADHVIVHEVKPHAYVRRIGIDIGESDVIKAGTVVSPVVVSTIMAMGHKSYKVHSKPRIGVLSTGDELENFFATDLLKPDSVIDSNGPLLTSMLRVKKYFVHCGGIARDDPSELLIKIQEALSKCDVLLITGGASMGTQDHVKDVIEHIGGTVHFGRVNIKPGKPAAFASLPEGGTSGHRKFIFSLPGNPVSAYITTLVLVLPFLEHVVKIRFNPELSISPVHIGAHVLVQIDSLVDGCMYKLDPRMEFVRAKILCRKSNVDLKRLLYSVEVSTKQQSSRMLNLVDCDCLILVDPEKNSTMTRDQIYPAIKLTSKFDF